MTTSSEALAAEFLKAKAVLVGAADDHLEQSQGKAVRAIAKGFMRARRRGKIRSTSSVEHATEQTKVGMGPLAAFFLSALVKVLLGEFVRWALKEFNVVQSCQIQYTED